MSQAVWDERWMGLANHVAQWSKDRSRKIGAVCVDNKHNDFIMFGWNGFPRGFDDDINERHERPTKYLYTCHAERNCCDNAAATGRPLRGATIYVNFFPCIECAKTIMQCGIVEVVGYEPDFNDPQYGKDFRQVVDMFSEKKVAVRYLDGDSPKQKVL